ncbi:hypothetical protein WDZ92_43300, partial [Nostoc sp. NIES-2111]
MNLSMPALSLGSLTQSRLVGLQPAAEAHAERTRQVIDAGLVALAHDRFGEMALALVNHLVQQQCCASVSLGWLGGTELQIVCRSGSAWQDRRASQLRLAEQAMAEALDEAQPLNLLTAAQASAEAVTAALRYTRQTGTGALAIRPLNPPQPDVGGLVLAGDGHLSPSHIAPLPAEGAPPGPIMVHSP